MTTLRLIGFSLFTNEAFESQVKITALAGHGALIEARFWTSTLLVLPLSHTRLVDLSPSLHESDSG